MAEKLAVFPRCEVTRLALATRRLRMAERRFRRKAEMALSSPHALGPPLPAAVDDR